jgi:hypothetical protein
MLTPLHNATAPRGDYGLPQERIDALHIEFNRDWAEVKHTVSPQFEALPYVDKILSRISDGVPKSMFDLASLGDFNFLSQQIEEFKRWMNNNQKGLSYLLNVQYSGPETFPHQSREFDGIKHHNYEGYSLLHFVFHVVRNSIPRSDQYLFWMTSYLLQCGIDPNIQDARGEIAMHAAAWWYGGASYDVARIWFSPEAGIRGEGEGLAESNNLDRKKFNLNTNRELYEHYARCCMAVVGMLLEYGADWNARDNQGRTVEDVWKEIYATIPPHVKPDTTGIRFGRQECVEAYRHFVLNAEKSIDALLDERTRGPSFCMIESEDPIWVVINGVVEKETEYMEHPTRRQELIAARTPQPEKGVVITSLPSSHAGREAQRRQEKQVKDDACCVVM